MIDDLLRDAGATLGQFHDRQADLDYGDWRAEHAALVGAAGLVWRGDRTQLELTGDDRADFLNRLATNKIVGLAPGSGCETFLTDAKGRVLAHLSVFAGPDSLVLETAPGQGAALAAHLDYYLIRERVEIHDRSAEWSEILVAGPQSPVLLAAASSGALAVGRLEHHLDHLAVSWSGAPVSFRRVELGAATTWRLSCPAEAAPVLWQVLRDAGARPCGQIAIDALRIESGWPEYGRDITAGNLPQEVARDSQTISFTKGCYLGQETVARLESRGHVNKKLAGVRFSSAELPPVGLELTADGQPAGRVTSSCFSPHLAAPLALAYVRRPHHTPGTHLDSPLGPASVIDLPLP